MRERLERLLGLGVSDEPRPVSVASKKARFSWDLRSTPGSKLLIRRDGWDGEVQRALVAVLQAGVPVELQQGEPGIFWEGTKIPAAELRRRLRQAR